MCYVLIGSIRSCLLYNNYYSLARPFKNCNRLKIMHITYDKNCVLRCDNTNGARREKLKHFCIGILLLYTIMLFNI